MAVPILGLITIGQAPRPDLEAEFRQQLPWADVRLVGALDGLSDEQVYALERPPHGYPLVTKLCSGRTVQVDLDRLIPLVTRNAERLADQGARAVVVLCAGDFPAISCQIPVILPGRVMPGLASALSPNRRIGVVVPVSGQVEPARRKWQRDGFSVKVNFASPYAHSEVEYAASEMINDDLDLIVLDCLGHGVEFKSEFAKRTGKPVLLAQSAVARAAAEFLEGYRM